MVDKRLLVHGFMLCLFGLGGLAIGYLAQWEGRCQGGTVLLQGDKKL